MIRLAVAAVFTPTARVFTVAIYGLTLAVGAFHPLAAIIGGLNTCARGWVAAVDCTRISVVTAVGRGTR